MFGRIVNDLPASAEITVELGASDLCVVATIGAVPVHVGEVHTVHGPVIVAVAADKLMEEEVTATLLELLAKAA